MWVCNLHICLIVFFQPIYWGMTNQNGLESGYMPLYIGVYCWQTTRMGIYWFTYITNNVILIGFVSTWWISDTPKWQSWDIG